MNQALKKPHPFNINSLYAVTPDLEDTDLLIKKVDAALQGGVQIIQYRNKAASQYLCVLQASALLDLCRQYGAKLIINDYLDLCVKIDADGLHLGGTDGDIANARNKLGDSKIIGASCYNQPDLAIKAETAGASYVAFGACFPSQTKPNALKADLSLFQTKLNIPKVAIGGITVENAPQVIAAGASAIAVVGALFNVEDIAKTSQQFANLFDS